MKTENQKQKKCEPHGHRWNWDTCVRCGEIRNTQPPTNNQLKAEQYVRQAIPALLELSFGCEVHHKYQKTYHRFVGLEKNTGYVIVQTPFDTEEKFERTKWSLLDLDVTGHPIALHHWLQVLDQKQKLYRLCNAGVLYWNHGTPQQVIIHFKNGQPESEADYLAINSIFGV